MFARVPALVAYETAKQNKTCFFPPSTDPRLAPIACPKFSPSFFLHPGESVFTIGSCFARGIEKTLVENGYKVHTLKLNFPKEEWPTKAAWPGAMMNKYNPYSMLNEINAAFGKIKGEDFLIETASAVI